MSAEFSTKPAQSAIFAAGCFWCPQATFDALPGVLTTTVGYTGGELQNPTYQQVCRGETGHFEAIKVTFDPSIISYEQLLDIFWHNIDPLDGNGQFCDRGDSYRSAIFYSDNQQKSMALKSKANIENQLKSTVATAIIPVTTFYPAEAYHQKYHTKNPIRYKTYRQLCGRVQRLNEIWGKQDQS